MNNSTLVFLINDDVRAISATYEEDGSPTTFKTMDDSVSMDDYIVVQSSTRHKMTVVKVVDVDVDVDLESNIKIDWIVGKIDTSNLDLVVEQEAKAITAVQSAEKRKKREELRQALFADSDENIKALELANSNAEVTE